MFWSLQFDDPIMLANGNVLFTLRDAANHVMTLPKTESAQAHWQLAIECLLARRGARHRDDGTDRYGEGAEPWPAGRAGATEERGEGVQAVSRDWSAASTVPR